MIKADHKKWARRVYDWYIGSILKKNFSGFYLIGDFPEIDAAKPLLVTPNHISWWDGFFVDFIFKPRIKRNIHLMMLERELAKFKFFSKVGAFSINPGERKSVIETREYLTAIVTDINNFAVMYPQGEIEAFEKKPLDIKPGLRFFSNSLPPETQILPIVFKIQYYNKKFPSVLCKCGNPVSADFVVRKYEEYINIFQQNVNELNSYIFANKEPENNLFK